MSDLGSTIKVKRSWRPRRPGSPPGLLLFFSPENGAAMSYHVLVPPAVEIGRANECQIVLDDPETSRVHASLEEDPGGWRISDRDSANGVHVNGAKVKRRQLEPDDVIRIGATLMCYLQEGLEAASGDVPVSGEDFVGGPRVDGVLKLLTEAARSDLNVLITGETGTGKELAVRRLHDASSRAGGPFVAVNCASIPGEMAESELFGHVRGAFTGAADDREGLIRSAEGGTLFLDEIGEMSGQIQAKLLRVLQDHRVRPVGASAEVRVDMRLVAATNRNLDQQMQDGRFRADLFARIADLEVHLPPLRERVEDIPLLVRHFLDKHGRASGDVPVETLEFLCCQPWRHNVRQLESAVRRAVVLARNTDRLEPEHFVKRGSPAAIPREREGVLDPAVVELDKVLKRHGGDMAAAAAELGISRSQLYRRARSLGIQPRDYR